MEPITLEELLSELQKHGISSNDQKEALSVYELTKIWKKQDSTVRKILKQASEAGLLGITKKRTTTIDGRDFQVPAYYFLNNKSESKKPVTRRKKK